MTAPLPTYRTTLGIAKEATYGTAVPATAFIPVNSMAPVDKLNLLDDNNWRGSAVESYGHTGGPLYAEFDFGGSVFADGILWPIAGILGDVVTTGASAPYTTTVALLNTGSTQGKSYTLSDMDAINTRQYPGMKFSELGFKFDGGGLLEYTAKAVGLSSAINASPPTPSFTTVPIEAAWTGATQVGGSSTGIQLVTGEFNLKRAADPINTVDGTQAPFVIWQGPITVDGKLTLVALADTLQANYISGTTTSLDFNFTQGTGAAATQVKLHASNVIFTDVARSFGKTYIEFEITYVADANVTDIGASAGYSPCKITVQNALASGTVA